MLPVLQISDLHRSTSDPVGNAQLVATVLAEHDRATSAGMPAIRAIVVCGDLIQGCRLGAPHFADELTAQYQVAKDLLVTLTNELLRGDRSRVILVPGNHDICWNSAVAAMEEAGADDQGNAYKLLHQRDSAFRWNWSTRRLFKIVNQSGYSSRLSAYRTFLTGFYDTTPPEIINGNAHLYEVDDIVFVGFESCQRTDCFNHSADIDADTISHVATRLRQQRYLLRVAVWHHSLEGPPLTSDYLDKACVRRLLYHGFRLGLHGHQHFAAVSPVYINADQDIMAVISAGSLCAGRTDLPPGRNRGFNFVVIDAGRLKARVQSLAMDMETRVQPEYGFNGGSAERDVSWSRSPSDATPGEKLRESVLVAEQAHKAGRHPAAIALLLPAFEQLDTYGRDLLFEALLSNASFDHIVARFEDALDVSQTLRLIAALADAHRPTDALRILHKYEAVLSADVVTYHRDRLHLALKEGVPRVS